MTKKKRNKKKLSKLLNKNHRKFAVLITVLSIVSLFSFIGTFAWFTSSDITTNKFDGGKLIAEIEEIFQPNQKWEPGEKTKKEVRVANTGEVPAFVRVSLYEFMLNFKVDVEDQTGNANLTTVKDEAKPSVMADNTDTWKAAADSSGTFKQKDKHYVASKAWVSDPKNRKEMFKLDDPRDKVPHKYISMHFSDDVKLSKDDNTTSDYWLYSNGYFYYSRPLKPSEKSNVLLESLTLSESIPNKYKGSLYKLKVYMDAHDVTSPVLDAWQLTDPNDPAYQLIKGQIK